MMRISMLGYVRVSVGSRTIEESEWRLKKAASLLKLLALAPQHRLRRERAMDLLWPEDRRTSSVAEWLLSDPPNPPDEQNPKRPSVGASRRW